MNDIKNNTAYHSLSQIKEQKEAIRNSIQEDDRRMKELWNKLFHHEPTHLKTPTKRFAGIMNTGANLLDGLILGWKLYRKFNKKNTTKKK
ncbi:MAG: hypothetical protein ILA04_03455 [Prevotella sp.]|nr:hypothetical protein [Prevotella sp.]